MAAERQRYGIIEDRLLVAAALAGSHDAFDELVRRYRGAVILVAWKALGSREAAQDAAQEAFVTAFRLLGQLKDPARFGPWLCTIARNGARRAVRLETRTCSMDGEQLDLQLSTHCHERIADPEQELLKRERDTAIRGLMEGLPSGVQIVLQLYYGEQWDVARIAEFLSLTRTTVKWRLHTGRKQIAGEFAKWM